MNIIYAIYLSETLEKFLFNAILALKVSKVNKICTKVSKDYLTGY